MEVAWQRFLIPLTLPRARCFPAELPVSATVLRGLVKLYQMGQMKENNKRNERLQQNQSFSWSSHLIINCNNLMEVQPKEAKMLTKARPSIALVHEIFLCLLGKPYPTWLPCYLSPILVLTMSNLEKGLRGQKNQLTVTQTSKFLHIL